MERRSEIVEGLEALRETILGYDAAADPKGTAWDELRVELDREVLNLIIKAQRTVAGETRKIPVLDVRHVFVTNVDPGVLSDTAANVKVLDVKLEAWPSFRRELPATWCVQWFSGEAWTDHDPVDLAYTVHEDGMHRAWGESDRARDFIAAKLKVRARIGEHYRVGRPVEWVPKHGLLAAAQLVVQPTPYLVGRGPAEVDPNACLVTPLTEEASIWLQNQAAEGVEVLHKGWPLATAEADASLACSPVLATSGEKVPCQKCRGLHAPDWDCSHMPGTGRGVRAG